MSDKDIIQDYASSAEVLLSARKKLINMPSAEDLDSASQLASKRSNEHLKDKPKDITDAEAKI